MLTDKQHRNFWKKVRVNPAGCWEWTASCFADGYGQVKIAGRNMSAHRVAYDIYHGQTPLHLCVCHTCDNRKCVRREHLFLGTQQDNTADRQAKMRQARGPAHALATTRSGLHRQNVRRGAAGGGAKFSDATIARVHELRATGLSQRCIADQLGMSQPHVCLVLNGKTRVEFPCTKSTPRIP